MRIVTVSISPKELLSEIKEAEAKHGRRFGHAGEWRFQIMNDDDDIEGEEEGEEDIPSGPVYMLHDPISNICMMGLTQEELARAWLNLLHAYATSRSRLRKNVRFDIFKRDGYRCCVCGAHRDRDGMRLHVDHILPIDLGGNDHPDNLRTLCSECNLARGSNLIFGLEVNF